jgi:hypothetical protein
MQVSDDRFQAQSGWNILNAEIAKTWFLHHDNASSHTSFAVREFLAQHNITTFPHPPYSPDLAPCDFFLFPKLKTHLK